MEQQRDELLRGIGAWSDPIILERPQDFECLLEQPSVNTPATPCRPPAVDTALPEAQPATDTTTLRKAQPSVNLQHYSPRQIARLPRHSSDSNAREPSPYEPRWTAEEKKPVRQCQVREPAMLKFIGERPGAGRIWLQVAFLNRFCCISWHGTDASLPADAACVEFDDCRRDGRWWRELRNVSTLLKGVGEGENWIWWPVSYMQLAWVCL
ncbi:hypothetical protein B0T16DRAFT_143789 [Cercophora newfieldiana]|uniref:Uncharacterized protein n=1 Tax=Cercophora newfieldiana TaxID=92897 RepID=A0AA39Y416_9PEZI|nr:hypothetical protein B0T16DRAFT_143789 [Cercophora newfieldiana]